MPIISAPAVASETAEVPIASRSRNAAPDTVPGDHNAADVASKISALFLTRVTQVTGAGAALPKQPQLTLDPLRTCVAKSAVKRTSMRPAAAAPTRGRTTQQTPTATSTSGTARAENRAKGMARPAKDWAVLVGLVSFATPAHNNTTPVTSAAAAPTTSVDDHKVMGPTAGSDL